MVRLYRHYVPAVVFAMIGTDLLVITVAAAATHGLGSWTGRGGCGSRSVASPPRRSRGECSPTSRLRELVDEMSSKADFVICDSSPVLLIADNLLLASAVDGVILVARAGSTGFRDLARTKTLLEGAGSRAR